MKAVLIVTGGILAFLGGLAGIYAAMPVLVPERAQQAPADSLAGVPADSLASADSLAAPGHLPDTTGTHPDSLVQGAPLEGTAAAVSADSLAAMQQRLAVLTREKESLAAELAGLKQERAALEARKIEAGALSATVAKLEDRELKRLVEQLDPAVLEGLYRETTERNRARLLQAMPPGLAAGFVSRLMHKGGRPVAADAAGADTLAAQDKDRLDTASANR